MSGIGKFLGNVFKAVVKVAKVVLPIALGVGAILFTGGAALGLTGVLAGGWGGAAAGITSALGLADTGIGAVLTSAITTAGYGAVAGGAVAAATGQNVLKGIETGAASGAILGGVTGGIGAITADAIAPVTVTPQAFTGLDSTVAADAGAASSGAAGAVTADAAPLGAAVTTSDLAPATAAPAAASGAGSSVASALPLETVTSSAAAPAAATASSGAAGVAGGAAAASPSIFRGLTNDLGLTNPENANGTGGGLTADGKTVLGDVISGVGKGLLAPAPDAAEKDYQKFVTGNYAQTGAPAAFQGLSSDPSGVVARTGAGLPQPAQAYNKQIPYEYFYNTQTKQIEKRPLVAQTGAPPAPNVTPATS